LKVIGVKATLNFTFIVWIWNWNSKVSPKTTRLHSKQCWVVSTKKCWVKNAIKKWKWKL